MSVRRRVEATGSGPPRTAPWHAMERSSGELSGFGRSGRPSRAWPLLQVGMPELDRRRDHSGRGCKLRANQGCRSMQAAISFTAFEDWPPAGIEHGEFDLVFAERARLRARSARLILANLWLWDAESELPTVGCARTPDDMLMVALSMRSERPLKWGGVSAEPGDLVTIGPAQLVHLRTEAACRFGAIWLPAAKFAALGTAVAGRVISVPPIVGRWHPPRDANRRLRHLYSAAMHAARAGKGSVASPEAAHGLEQQVIHALAECLCGKSTASTTPRVCRVQGLMSRFEEIVRRGADVRPGVAGLCEELGVSQGALRHYCHRFLGMGPSSYIRLHRKHSETGVPPRTQRPLSPDPIRNDASFERSGQ